MRTSLGCLLFPQCRILGAWRPDHNLRSHVCIRRNAATYGDRYRAGIYVGAAAYAHPSTYTCANSDAVPDGRANSDAAAYGDAAAYANSDAAPARRAIPGFHPQHSKRPMG